MNSGWQRQVRSSVVSVALALLLGVSPAAAHEGHGGTTTAVPNGGGGFDIGGLLPYIGIGVVALVVGGLVLWREMSYSSH